MEKPRDPQKASDLLVMNIERLLAEKGWKAADLVRATGRSTGLIYKAIDGSRFPSPDNLDLIARALGVSVADLFVGPEGFRETPITWDQALEVIERGRPDEAKPQAAPRAGSGSGRSSRSGGSL